MTMAHVFVNVLLSLTVAAVLIVGVVLMMRGRGEHGRAAVLGLWGCVVLLAGIVLGVVRGYALPFLADALGMQSLSIVLVVESALQTLLTVVGTGLLIWAVIARRPPARDPRQPAWQPPPPPPPYQQPRQPPQPPGH
ncbi:hypothetical protein [Nonomuraea indica]|uniref:Uncharacterized protein n=1 Tax=Nonomuraea indica TaxID=1581193 RepID=A0ABW8A178_9ACTN